MGNDLREMKDALIAIEAAHHDGLRLIPKGNGISVIPADTGYNADEAKIGFALLKKRQESVVGLINEMPQTLSETQGRMVVAYDWLMDHLDLWDRMEKAYRLIYPEDDTCIRGDAGCLPNAIVCCKKCEGK
jgi:hypothetical protein